MLTAAHNSPERGGLTPSFLPVIFTMENEDTTAPEHTESTESAEAEESKKTQARKKAARESDSKSDGMSNALFLGIVIAFMGIMFGAGYYLGTSIEEPIVESGNFSFYGGDFDERAQLSCRKVNESVFLFWNSTVCDTATNAPDMIRLCNATIACAPR